ncbi:hypothetical protein CALVIDRAFT_540078 [Calocera viscosa TUFC12733]|uniref:Uncharacterized protein n=1 Tax=Calocera viscosa (strain TUFC12733) TaxID=1330018 RepID=A0A167J8Q2_CALVF|nr:hypothetical protein CALVIDRAFT_540078 [Calocera viscosa TUFC12733]
MQDQIARLPEDDAYRHLLQTELDNMSKKHKVWEYEWTRNGEEFPDIPASDGDDDETDDDEIEEILPPPSVTAQPSPHHTLPPMSFKIPSGPDSSPVSPAYPKSSTTWRGPSGSGPHMPETYASSSAGDSSGRPSMTSQPDGVGTSTTPAAVRKTSIGGISGYSADDTSPRDMESSGEDYVNPNLPDFVPLRRRRRKPGEWVVKVRHFN